MYPYYFSFDNPKNRNYACPKNECKKVAFVESATPKTTLRLDRKHGVTFAEIKAATARSLDPKNGRGILFSTRTGRVYTIDNRGNRPRVWRRAA